MLFHILVVDLPSYRSTIFQDTIGKTYHCCNTVVKEN